MSRLIDAILHAENDPHREAKDRFAKEYAASGDAMRASWAADAGNSVYPSVQWPDDPYVIAKVALLRAEDAERYLPTWIEHARRVYQVADSAPSFKERFEALEFYAVLRGWITRPAWKLTRSRDKAES